MSADESPVGGRHPPPLSRRCSYYYFFLAFFFVIFFFAIRSLTSVPDCRDRPCTPYFRPFFFAFLPAFFFIWVITSLFRS
jgi:hypothetical protein